MIDLWNIHNHKWYHMKVFLPFDNEMSDSDKQLIDIARANSPIHYLLAYEVFRPVIYEYSDKLYLWRFHRQFCSADEATKKRELPVHEFKFKFYTTRTVFDQIRKKIKSSKALKEIRPT